MKHDMYLMKKPDVLKHFFRYLSKEITVMFGKIQKNLFDAQEIVLVI